jgi:hypothetical protein
MTYCLAPNCQKPQNSDATKFCLTCGSQLLLKNQYQAIQPIGEGGFGRTFLAVAGLTQLAHLSENCHI